LEERSQFANQLAQSLTSRGLGNYSLRTERWRYISFEDGSEELYDHDVDPQEWKNLAGKPKYREIIKQLRKSIPKSK